MPSATISTNSNSSQTLAPGPGVSTNSNGASAFAVTVAHAPVSSGSIGVSSFSSDCGDLANGRYRR